MPTPTVLDAVAERLRREESSYVRAPLTRLLIREAPARAVSPLTSSVRSKQMHIRSDAVKIIREMPDPALVPVYETALASDFAYVRLAAVHALSEVKHPDRKRLLARALRDDNAEIQVQAAAGMLMPW